MSHYTKATIQAQQTYEAELLQALAAHFGAEGVESHGETKVELLTYNGTKSGRKANIVVRKATQAKKAGHYLAVNDLGYERNTEGTYDLHVDEDGFGKVDQDKVAQHYAELVATKRAKTLGYRVARKALEDGRVSLTLSR